MTFSWWERIFSKRVREYVRLERRALPDGTRVVLICNRSKCRFTHHDGVWVTSWTPRRTGDIDDPDDYRLTRERDGETTYALRNAIYPLERSDDQ